MATISVADLYGAPSSAPSVPQSSTSVVGPNQSSVASTTSVLAAPQGSAAFSWIGFILALIALRVLIEAAGTSRE